MPKKLILLLSLITACSYFRRPIPISNTNIHTSFKLKSKNSSDKNIGLLTIFAVEESESSSSNYTGHVFISITNISNTSFKIGSLALNPNVGITIGTWGNKSAHTGLWYNLEGYFYNKDSNTYTNRASVSTYINTSEIDKINAVVEKYNDKWSYFINCSSFATETWNQVGEYSLNAGFINTPVNLKKSIMTHSYTTNENIPYDYRIGYVKNGVFKFSTGTYSINNINDNNPYSF